MFCPLNSRKIKRSSASERSDQVIKDNFHRSRFLIAVANASIGDTYVTTLCTVGTLCKLFYKLDGEVTCWHAISDPPVPGYKF